MIQMLEEKYPCRSAFIKNLFDLISNGEESFPSAIFVYGHAGTGKTAIVKDFLRLVKNEKQIQGVYINCVECYSTKILLENTLEEFNYGCNTTSNIRCDSLKEFVELLRNANDKRDGKGYVLALDNAHRLRDMDANIMPSVLRLQELTGLNICVVLISQIPFEKFHSKTGLTEVMTLHCPQYTKSETLKILSTQFEMALQMLKSHLKDEIVQKNVEKNLELERQIDIINKIIPDFFNNYLNVFLSVFYKACRDIPELKITACNCFLAYMEPVLNESIDITDVSKLWRNIAAPLRSALSRVYMRHDNTEKNRIAGTTELRNDLLSFKNMLGERKKEKKFAWLGTLVATQMEDINPNEQADAAWQIQCLMRKLTSKSNGHSSTSSLTCTKDILELSMNEVFDEDDFI